MLVHHAVDGGIGGKAGRNGAGGAGGAGGEGGDSHSWTEYDTHTDADGNTHTDSTHHYNPGGSDGARGMDGMPGQARLAPGIAGPDGRIVFAVRGASGINEYTRRYHLRLVSFEHESSNKDLVYEPREAIRVSKITVENIGGMPTPAHADIHVTVQQQGWVNADEGQHLVLPRSVAPGERVALDGSLTFHVGEFRPREAADPLEIAETVRPSARVVSVRRDFENFQSGEALTLGEFLIRFPVRISEISSLRSLAPDAVSRLRFRVTNQSRLPLGKNSETKRRLRVRLSALESELGDSEIVLFGEKDEPLAPSSGYSLEIDELGAGETRDISISIGAKADAPAYRAITHRLVLELGDIDDPESLRTIQLRDFTTRIANRYRTDIAANLLLVVNHQTTASEISTWRTLAAQLGFIANIWDITLERHLNLRAELGHGRCLLDHFAGGTIAILNNSIEGASAVVNPHQFLSKADLYAANSEAIHIAFVGADPSLEQLLMPALAEAEQTIAPVQADSPDDLVTALATVPDRALVVADGKVEYHDREWWGGLPDVTDLSGEAIDVQDDLIAAYPDRRYVVVYDFEPEIASKFLWIKKWRMGEVEVKSTLDPVAGSVVHAAVSDLDIHSPKHILGDATVSTLLLARPFEDNLAALGQLLRVGSTPLLTDGDGPKAEAPSPLPTPSLVENSRLASLMIGALLTELAAEQDAIIATKWREGLGRDDLRGKMPRLQALSKQTFGDGLLLPGTAEGTHVVELAARLRFFADGQVKLWERTPPIRFLRRAPTVAVITKQWIDELLENTFGEHERHARKMMKKRIDAFEDQDPGRGYLARSLLYAPIDRDDVTSDDEAFADAGARVLSREDFEEVVALDKSAASLRSSLVAAQKDAEAELLRSEAASKLASEMS